MRFLIIGLAYLGYGFCFWGATLLGGGPQQTGSWPLMYALFGLGAPPRALKTEASGTSPADRFGAQV